MTNHYANTEQLAAMHGDTAEVVAARLAADKQLGDKMRAERAAADKAHNERMQAERAAAVEASVKGQMRPAFPGTDQQFETAWPSMFSEWQKGETLRRANDILATKRTEYANLF